MISEGFATMKELWKAAVFGLVTFAAWHQSAAQTVHTNASLSTTFTLTAYVQESKDTNTGIFTVSSRKFTNADIIQTLAVDLGLDTNNLSGAALILQAHDVTTNYQLNFTIRSETALIDVSTNIEAIVSPNSPSVSSVRPAPYGRTTNSTDMTIMEFSMVTTNASFDVLGPVTFQSSSLVLGRNVIAKKPFTGTFSATVSGSGKIDGKDAVFKGTVRGFGRKITIETTP